MSSSLLSSTTNPGAHDRKGNQGLSTTQFAWAPDLIYLKGEFVGDMALVCGADGNVVEILPATQFEGRIIRLKDRALLPALVNAHSHAFQRVIRGRTEYKANKHDSFWTWRELMYRAASRLSLEDVYDASRMAFLEMALSGITAVGEFHYLHRNAAGCQYDDPNLLALEVTRAARDVGVRIALLRVAYARSGYQTPADPRQLRFIEPQVDIYLRHTERLITDVCRLALKDTVWVGVAPHSVRAVPLPYLREVVAFASQHELPFHMHVAEQPAEVVACVRETGRTPLSLLYDEGMLGPRFTAVHATHIAPGEAEALGRTGSFVCACPTTERNLGDGILPADELLKRGVRIALGSDSQTQIDLLEDARELEYHLRLQRLERVVLSSPLTDGEENCEERTCTALARSLFDCATSHGAASIGAPTGLLEPGRPADFFTVDLTDSSIAGASPGDLLPLIVFSLQQRAIREVATGGTLIIEAGKHHKSQQIVERFRALQKRLWQN